MRRKRLIPGGRVKGTLLLLTSLVLTFAGADHDSRRHSPRGDESTGRLRAPGTTPGARMERLEPYNRELQQSANLFAPKESQMETMQSPKVSIDGSCVGSKLQAGQQRGKGSYLWCVFKMHIPGQIYKWSNQPIARSLQLPRNESYVQIRHRRER